MGSKDGPETDLIHPKSRSFIPGLETKRRCETDGSEGGV